MSLARLGAGPWSVVDVLEPDCATIGPQPHLAGLDLDRCACCGASLQWRVILQGPTGYACVGRTCADKASRATPESINLEGIGLKLKAAERRERDRMLADGAFAAWAQSQPHPKGWAGRSLLDDVRYHATGKTINLAPLRKAFKLFGVSR